MKMDPVSSNGDICISADSSDAEDDSVNCLEMELYAKCYQDMKMGYKIPQPSSSSTSCGCIGNNLRSVYDIPNFASLGGNIKTLNLHSNQLHSLEGIELLANLQELIASSNEIEFIGHLGELKNLRILDLSANKIKEIGGLVGLYKLQRLSMAYNRISNLEGLMQMWGNQYSLTYIDLRENCVRKLNDLMYLGGIHNMKELMFKNTPPSNEFNLNPICTIESYRLLVIQCASGLQKLDGVPVSITEREIVLKHPINIADEQEKLDMERKRVKDQSGSAMKLKKQQSESSLIIPATTEMTASMEESRNFNSTKQFSKELIATEAENTTVQEKGNKAVKIECCDNSTNTDDRSTVEPMFSIPPTIELLVDELCKCSQSFDSCKPYVIEKALEAEVTKGDEIAKEISRKLMKILKTFLDAQTHSSVLTKKLELAEEAAKNLENEIDVMKKRLSLEQSAALEQAKVFEIRQKEYADKSESLAAELKRKEMMLGDAMSRLNTSENIKNDQTNVIATITAELNEVKKNATKLEEKCLENDTCNKQFEEEITRLKQKEKSAWDEWNVSILRIKELESEALVYRSNENKKLLEYENDVHRLTLKHETEIQKLKEEFGKSLHAAADMNTTKMKQLQDEFKHLLKIAQNRVSSLQMELDEASALKKEQSKLLKSAELREISASKAISELLNRLEEEEKLSNKELYTHMDSTINSLRIENEELSRQSNVLTAQIEDFRNNFVKKEDYRIVTSEMDAAKSRCDKYKELIEELSIKVETLSIELTESRSMNVINSDAAHSKDVTIALKSRFVEELTDDVQKLKCHMRMKDEEMGELKNIMKRKEGELNVELGHANKKLMEMHDVYKKTVTPLQQMVDELILKKGDMELKMSQAQEVIYSKDRALDFAQKEVKQLKETMEKQFEGMRREYGERLEKAREAESKENERQANELRKYSKRIEVLEMENAAYNEMNQKTKALLKQRDVEMRVLLEENRKAKSDMNAKMKNVNALLKAIETDCTAKLP